MSKLVEDIHDVLRDRVSSSFKVSYEYPGYVLVCREGEDIQLFIGDIDGYVNWNTQYGVCGDGYDYSNLPIDELVDRIVYDVDFAGIFDPIKLGRE